MKGWSWLILSTAWSAWAALSEPSSVPANPFLADSAWPMANQNCYSQGSSPLAGPSELDKINETLLKTPRGATTLNVGPREKDDEIPIWGAAPGYGQKQRPQVYNIHIRDAQPTRGPVAKRPGNGGEIGAAISGAYVLTDHRGNFFVPEASTLRSYHRKDGKIVDGGTFAIAPAKLEKEEIIVGLNLTYDGYLVFATSRGLVGVIKREDVLESEPKPAVEFFRLEGEISNSLSIDENGGIYVVTSKELVRLQWDAGKPLSVMWRAAYPSKGKRGSLGEGSGTTPVLVGAGKEDHLVAIGDGETLMHMMLFWRDEIPKDWKVGEKESERRIAARVPVRYGDPKAQESFTDQHFVVYGYDLMTVSNRYGDIGDFLEKGTYSAIVHRGAKEVFGDDLDKWTIFYSNRTEIAPHGMELFRWDAKTRKLGSVWANREVSCPNAVPTMSQKSKLAYCIGQSHESWSLEAVDWNTGKSAFSYLLKNDPNYNSIYAATEICGDKLICSGVFGGALLLKQ